MNPFFSVIVPLYNKQDSVAKTVQSVLNQTYNDYELIIVDDGSTDRSLSILAGFSDRRIRILRQKNEGPSAARNTGIKNSRGEWIMLLDADDMLVPECLSVLAKHVINNPKIDVFVGAYCSDETIVRRYNKQRVIRNGHRAFVVDMLYFLAGTYICRRDLVCNVLFDSRLWKMEDLDFMLRIERCLLYQRKMIYVPDILVRIQSFYSSASKIRRPIQQDFRGYLTLSGRSFWERIAIYKLYVSCREDYPEDSRTLYAGWDRKRVLNGLRIITNYLRAFRLKVRTLGLDTI